MFKLHNDVMEIPDYNGNNVRAMYLDTIDRKGETYVAFVKTENDGTIPDDVEIYVYIVVVDKQSGEDVLAPIESDEESEQVAEIFFYRLQMRVELSGDNDENPPAAQAETKSAAPVSKEAAVSDVKENTASSSNKLSAQTKPSEKPNKNKPNKPSAK